MAVIKGLLGKKIGMTQIFKDGKSVVVTVISAGPCYVLDIKRKESSGYNALKIGYEELKPNSRKATRPLLGSFKKIKVNPLKFIREIRIENPKVLNMYKIGEKISLDIFKVGEFLDISAVSKGKGFQGGVKRWGWHIGPRSHGSMSHRSIGSIGASSFPSRVLKGLHMPGHMGNENMTVQNLEIVDIDCEKNILLIKGSIPGAKDSLLVIKSAKKKYSELECPKKRIKMSRFQMVKGK